MKIILSLIAVCLYSLPAFAQFTRTELNTDMDRPWEILYGPDDMLWVSERYGLVTRVDPQTGAKDTVYAAPDYFAGDPSEALQACHNPQIGSGTLGMGLHPDFLNPANAYIYYVYSYNSGTPQAPATKFKIVRLHWDASGDSVTAATDLATDIPTSYDHLGGRLMVIERSGTAYIFLTIGDHGISDDNSPDCYDPQSLNPNNHTQDPDSMNGKIHRYNIDGSIPSDNPIPGNPFWSRGHRNPQGLAYNPSLDILYDIEHGDRTDDEINVIHKGMNYGWKNVRGYHGDSNFPGEDSVIANYTPHPSIPNDSLVPAMWSWCDTTPPGSSNWLDWCTVAPSGGDFYGIGNGGIPGWENSLLAVTLKDGVTTDREVFRFKLNPDGMSLVPSTPQDPNPSVYFGADQSQNGRLRDIAISPDGLKIYLVNNGGTTGGDKLVEYAYTGPVAAEAPAEHRLGLYPNPVAGMLRLEHPGRIREVRVVDLAGRIMMKMRGEDIEGVDVSGLDRGMYFLVAKEKGGAVLTGRFLRD